jgi:hypothetical protein
MAYMKPLKERLHEDIDKLMSVYGVGEFEFNIRSLKMELREDIKAILQKNHAADNTPIQIDVEDNILVVRVGDYSFSWN